MNWLLFNSNCSNVDKLDQSGNGPEMGPLGTINTANLDRKDISYGKVPLMLLDFSPLGAVLGRS